MARSVGYASDAISTVYLHGELGDDELERDWAYHDLVSALQHELMTRYPSFDLADERYEREGRVILENVFAYVVLYQYYDLFTVNLVVKDRDYLDEHALADGWANRIAQGFEALLDERFDTLRKVATASNGESFFERKGQP